MGVVLGETGVEEPGKRNGGVEAGRVQALNRHRYNPRRHHLVNQENQRVEKLTVWPVPQPEGLLQADYERGC